MLTSYGQLHQPSLFHFARFTIHFSATSVKTVLHFGSGLRDRCGGLGGRTGAVVLGSPTLSEPYDKDEQHKKQIQKEPCHKQNAKTRKRTPTNTRISCAHSGTMVLQIRNERQIELTGPCTWKHTCTTPAADHQPIGGVHTQDSRPPMLAVVRQYSTQDIRQISSTRDVGATFGVFECKMMQLAGSFGNVYAMVPPYVGLTLSTDESGVSATTGATISSRATDWETYNGTVAKASKISWNV